MMQESMDKVATLKDNEPEIFALFAEYAYTGLYQIPAKAGERSHLKTPNEAKNNKSSVCFCCIFCGDDASSYEHFPFCQVHYCPGNESGTVRCTMCGWYRYDLYDLDSIVLCKNCTPVETEGYLYKQSSKTPRASNAAIAKPTPSKKTSSARRHLAAGMSQDELHAYLAEPKPQDTSSNMLSAHAKLYLFAQEYMIQPLQDLCLHKLNRDLMAFAVEAHNIAEVVDLLVYTYENTSNNIGRFEGVGSKLRDLVNQKLSPQPQMSNAKSSPERTCSSSSRRKAYKHTTVDVAGSPT